MSTSTTGPPPGFESANVNSDSAAADVTAPDPTDVPQSTSLGGGDPRRTGDQSEVPASDDGSQGRRAGSDQSAGDPHSGGGSTTQAEWSWDQSAASTGPDGGERWQSANAGADAAGDRRGSWSTAADPSGSTRGRDPWTDSDP